MTLDAASVEAIARRVVELLRETTPVGVKPLTVAEVANIFGRSHEWVRDHRNELGVLPATGTRPRLMFDSEKVREFICRAPTREATEPKAKPHTRRRSRSHSTADLLPIRGRGT